MVCLLILAERSSVEDSDGEEDFEKDKETSDEQAEGGLNAFYALGCELTGISRSVLSSDTPVGNFSAAECHRILKVLSKVCKLCIYQLDSRLGKQLFHLSITANVTSLLLFFFCPGFGLSAS